VIYQYHLCKYCLFWQIISLVISQGFMARAKGIPALELYRLAQKKKRKLVLCGHSLGGAVSLIHPSGFQNIAFNVFEQFAYTKFVIFYTGSCISYSCHFESNCCFIFIKGKWECLGKMYYIFSTACWKCCFEGVGFPCISFLLFLSC
jgi:hypothetical protein